MKHSIKKYNPDRIYEIVITGHFSIKAKSAESAREKLTSLLEEIDADGWQIHHVCEADN